MKNKILLTILAISCLSFTISSCNDNVTLSDSEDNISSELSIDNSTDISSEFTDNSEADDEIKSLKVLSIGNSFAVDTVEHIPNIAKNLGVEEIKFGTLYIGGCSINKHLDNASNNLSNYEYYVNEGNGWSMTYNHSIYNTLKSEEWDYISIQHGTGDGSRYADISSYYGLEELIDYIKVNAIGEPKIAFNMTWVGEKGSHEELINVFKNDTTAYYNAICDLTSNTLTKIEDLDIISPTGTAIQNARTAQLGSLTRDNYHLSLTTGRYTAGLTFFMALTGQDIKDLSWAPSGMSQYMIDVAKESACNAIINPYSVTNSNVEVPEFTWPTNVEYGDAATPDNPYYPHVAKKGPNVAKKIDLMQYFNISSSYPLITSTLQSPNNMWLTINLNETPYLYYSFIVPENSDFTFSIYSNTDYAPWLTFLDASKGDAKLGQSAEEWDALFSSGRKQYTNQTQTGCINLKDYAKENATKWIISMMKLYAPKGDGVTLSYFFIGSN